MVVNFQVLDSDPITFAPTVVNFKTFYSTAAPGMDIKFASPNVLIIFIPGQVLTSGGMLMNGIQGGYIVGNQAQYSMHGGSAYADNTPGNVMQR